MGSAANSAVPPTYIVRYVFFFASAGTRKHFSKHFVLIQLDGPWPTARLILTDKSEIRDFILHTCASYCGYCIKHYQCHQFNVYLHVYVRTLCSFYLFSIFFL